MKRSKIRRNVIESTALPLKTQTPKPYCSRFRVAFPFRQKLERPAVFKWSKRALWGTRWELLCISLKSACVIRPRSLMFYDILKFKNAEFTDLLHRSATNSTGHVMGLLPDLMSEWRLLTDYFSHFVEMEHFPSRSTLENRSRKKGVKFREIKHHPRMTDHERSQFDSSQGIPGIRCC